MCGQPTGDALLEHLFDLAGLSRAALVVRLAASDVRRALLAAGQASAINGLDGAVAEFDTSKGAPEPFNSGDDTAQVSISSLSSVLPGLYKPESTVPAKGSLPAISEGLIKTLLGKP